MDSCCELACLCSPGRASVVRKWAEAMVGAEQAFGGDGLTRGGHRTMHKQAVTLSSTNSRSPPQRFRPQCVCLYACAGSCSAFVRRVDAALLSLSSPPLQKKIPRPSAPYCPSPPAPTGPPSPSPLPACGPKHYPGGIMPWPLPTSIHGSRTGVNVFKRSHSR